MTGDEKQGEPVKKLPPGPWPPNTADEAKKTPPLKPRTKPKLADDENRDDAK